MKKKRSPQNNPEHPSPLGACVSRVTHRKDSPTTTLLLLFRCYSAFSLISIYQRPVLPHMSNIPGSAHANLSLGVLVMLGGIAGFLRKGSKASLVAGLSMGSLLLGSGYMIAKTDQIYEGHLLAGGTSGVMALAMGQRYLSTSKFMPAGMVAVLGAAACAYNLHKSQEWAPEKTGTCLFLFWCD